KWTQVVAQREFGTDSNGSFGDQFFAPSQRYDSSGNPRDLPAVEEKLRTHLWPGGIDYPDFSTHGFGSAAACGALCRRPASAVFSDDRNWLHVGGYHLDVFCRDFSSGAPG